MKRIILIPLSLLLCFLVGCNGRYQTVSIEDVESVSVWTHSGRYELTEDEATKFIELYNNSEYKGKATGEGGTPEFGVIISLKNGKEMHVQEFCGKHADFEAFGNAKNSFYLDNQEILSYITKLCEDNIA